MTRVVVKKIVWDEVNLEHIGKHSVTKLEVENAIEHSITHRKAKKGRYVLIGRSGQRLISVLIDRKQPGVYYVATARDSNKKERRIAYAKEKI